MKEFIEKLIGRLEEEAFDCIVAKGYAPQVVELDCIIKIVNELAEEHECEDKTDYANIELYAFWQKHQWIPCSERLPEDDSICIVTVEYPNNETEVDYGWFDRVGVCWYVGIPEFRTSNILAWQPLPEPYHPKGE